jgi:hypothetical protein
LFILASQIYSGLRSSFAGSGPLARRFVYVLKEICVGLEAGLLTDVQQRLALLREIWTTTMVTASFINRLSQAVERWSAGLECGVRPVYPSVAQLLT